MISGPFYKDITIVNDDSRIINKLETSLTDDARVIIYDHHMFIVQATGECVHIKLMAECCLWRCFIQCTAWLSLEICGYIYFIKFVSF